MMIDEDYETLDRSVITCILYGITNGLAYLGEGAQVILDEMGEVMLEYLFKIRILRTGDNQEKLSSTLQEFFARNGFGKNIILRFKEDTIPPTPYVPNFISYLASDPKTELGGARGDEAGKNRVDWVICEMILYGETRALEDSMGTQAQILIDRIGAEM